MKNDRRSMVSEGLINRYIEAITKVELHVHLEGSIQPSSLLKLARRNDVDLPVSTIEEARDWFVFRDFGDFSEIFNAITKCFRKSEDFEFIVHELGSELARQHTMYAEVTFSPSTQKWQGNVDQDTYLEGLSQGRKRVMEDFGVRLNWIFDLVRDSSRWESMAEYTTRVAIESAPDGVVALGLGGWDKYGPPEEFERWFDMALSVGLGSNPHAGEFAGPENIWGAIRALKADRIIHGVKTIQDPALIEYLIDNEIPLDLCPTSNLRLGIVADYSDHPLRTFYDSGIIITVNTDDPQVFNTTLTDELKLLVDPFGLDIDDIDMVMMNTINSSFLGDLDKDELMMKFRSASESIKRDLRLSPKL